MYEFNPAISSAVRTTGAAPRAAEPRAGSPLPPDLLGSDAPVLAGGQLPDRRPDLPPGQPAAARAAPARAHQAAAARPLGHVARAEPHLRAPQPADPRARRQRDLPGRARARRSRRSSPTSTSKAPTPRSTRTCRRDADGHADACSASSRRPAASRATSACRRPARSTRAASSATCSSTPSARPSTTRTSIVAAVVGDGEAETGPLEGSWKSVSFLNPARDGAVLPILHLNGYKIAGPTVLGRVGRRRRRGAAIEGHGYEVHFVEGDDPTAGAPGVRRDARPRAIAGSAPSSATARAQGVRGRPRWPAIVLRTPKGWTGPQEVDGLPVEGTFRAHQVPLPDVKADAGAARAARGVDAQLPAGARCSTRTAGWCPSSPRWRREGDRRMGANPHANGGTLLVDLDLPDFGDYAVAVPPPAVDAPRVHPPARRDAARHLHARMPRQANFRLFCPDETNSNRLGDVFEVENRCFVGPTIGIDDHVRAGRPRHGGAERAPLRGLARGLPAHRAPRAVRHLRGVRHGLGLDDRAARQVARGERASCPGARRSPRSTSC